MSYKVIIDSCGELTEEMKASGNFETASLSISVDDYHVIDDENFDQIAHLRGGFKYNENGEEDFTFTGGFVQLNVNITEMKEDYKLVPGALLDEVAKGVMENLED